MRATRPTNGMTTLIIYLKDKFCEYVFNETVTSSVVLRTWAVFQLKCWAHRLSPRDSTCLPRGTIILSLHKCGKQTLRRDDSLADTPWRQLIDTGSSHVLGRYPAKQARGY